MSRELLASGSRFADTGLLAIQLQRLARVIPSRVQVRGRGREWLYCTAVLSSNTPRLVTIDVYEPKGSGACTCIGHAVECMSLRRWCCVVLEGQNRWSDGSELNPSGHTMRPAILCRHPGICVSCTHSFGFVARFYSVARGWHHIRHRVPYSIACVCVT